LCNILDVSELQHDLDALYAFIRRRLDSGQSTASIYPPSDSQIPPISDYNVLLCRRSCLLKSVSAFQLANTQHMDEQLLLYKSLKILLLFLFTFIFFILFQ
jgi:hypothetical protein